VYLSLEIKTMCDCERIKLELLKELEREAIIKKGEAWIPINAILNRIYKIKDLKDGKDIPSRA